MIDLHCHILPGVDDGARSLDEAVEMARMAAAAGTRTIVATPHMLHPRFHVPGDVARRKHRQVQEAVAAAGIDVEIVLGGEIHYNSEVVTGLESGELIPLCAERRYILFELPSSHVPGTFRDVIWRLQTKGVFPVLAHPERNHDFERKPDTIHEVREAGVPIQVTAMSVTGRFGRKAKKVARRWIKEGVVDLIASDGHGCGKRPPVMDEAARIVRKLGGATLEQWVTAEAPRRILAGEGVLT